jgi:hypothetical protein
VHIPDAAALATRETWQKHAGSRLMQNLLYCSLLAGALVAKFNPGPTLENAREVDRKAHKHLLAEAS